MTNKLDNGIPIDRQKPKLLILIPKSLYLNPTEKCFINALQRRFEVVKYGPGYLSTLEIKDDIRIVCEELGPFDGIIIHQYFLLNNLKAASESGYFAFDVNGFLTAHPQFPSHYDKLPCPVFALMLRADVYSFSESYIKTLERFSGYIIAWPADFVAPLDQLNDLEKESFGKQATDRYRDFAIANDHRIIPVIHVIGNDEFCEMEWKKKNLDVCIPGVQYYTRKSASRILEASGRKAVISPLSIRIVYRLASLFNIKLQRSSWGIWYLNHNFRKMISYSKLCYTDGSLLRYPVRKFFEIPAFGSLLVADPCVGTEELGFRNEVSFLSAKPEELPDLIGDVLQNEDRTIKIIKAGQRLISERHSGSARAEQFYGIFRKVVKGDFNGARWHQGELIF